MRTGKWILQTLILSVALTGASAVYAEAAERVGKMPGIYQGESITIKEEDTVEFSGTITDNDNLQEYTYTAPRNGTYLFEQTDLTDGTYMKSYVYDKLGNTIADLWCSDYETVDLDEGETYKISVPQYQSYKYEYKIIVCQQKESTDITKATEVHDQITYKGQKNIYFFETPVNGYYRFDIESESVNSKFGLEIWDSNGTNILDRYYGTTGELVELDGSEKYQIEVWEYEDFGSYTLHIYQQKPRQDVGGYETVQDSIEYDGQCNYYEFPVLTDGTYSFVLDTPKSGNKFDVYVWDSNGNQVKDDWTRDVDLGSGETYVIGIAQEEGRGDYSLNITYPSGAIEQYPVPSVTPKDETETDGNQVATDETEGDVASEDLTQLQSENEKLKEENKTLKEQNDKMLDILHKIGVKPDFETETTT